MAYLKAYITTLFLLLCFSVTGQDKSLATDSVAQERAVEYYYIQARSYMEQDSLDSCFEILEHCHQLDTASLAVMYDLSSFYAFLNKDSIAHDMLVRIVDADPSNIYYNKALVNYYLKIDDVDAAIGVYEKLLDSIHSKNEIYMYLFSLYSETGHYEKAIDMLGKIEKLEGTNEDIVISKLHLYMALGDSAKAIEFASQMVEDNPDDLRYWGLLGNTYQSLGNRDKALEVYRKILEIKPDDVYALLSLAELHVNDEDDSVYCACVERVLKCEDFDAQARVNTLVDHLEYMHLKDSARAMSLIKEMSELPFDELSIADVYRQYLMYVKASPDTIIPVLEKIHSLDPENLSVIVQLLEYAIERNDPEAVFRYAENAQLYCPDRLEVYYYKGMSSYMLGRKTESIDIYKEGLEKRAEDTEPGVISALYETLGDTYHELDMLEECLQAYDSALVYDQENVGVLNNYAYFLALDNRELNRALDMSYRTIVKEPENPTCIDTYAWVLFKLGRYEEAKAYAEKLLTIDEDISSEVYHHCGDIYAKCGEVELAVSYWIKAREAGDESKILGKKIKKRKYYKDAKRK